MDKNKMLIDATHPEETRVVALRNGRVEEFDFESAARKLLRGNIYLAKVTRVEPSLQAAFIDYGGNRHGFLAFSEIHPDYYQIPVADREMLKQEEAEAEQRAEAEADERARSRGPRRRRNRSERGDNGEAQNGQAWCRDDQPSEVDTFEGGYQTSVGQSRDEDEAEPATNSQPLRHGSEGDDVRHAEPEPLRSLDEAQVERTVIEPARGSSESIADDWSSPPEAPIVPTAPPAAYPLEARRSRPAETFEPQPAGNDIADGSVGNVPDEEEDDETGETNGNDAGEEDQVEQVVSEEDVLEEVPERPRRRARQYKIQEVIKRRQIMLVQVVKEERGNKGAALTTYISLAGRYTVLMPNTARGGGISRKITQPQDRKRLKAIAEELDVQEGMGLIIRTAGAARTKQEIKRDYDYLIRLWESVRDLTLSSTAPCLVYEEGNLIKRAIRDLYSKDFDQLVVAGDVAHREAQDFMEMLMPGSGSQVASYRAPEPLFARFGIERQLNALFSPYVTLRSGGYIVINQTEALVSVDVNSGKSTREFSIEETALNTNLEAAEEIARQLKLRDLAGLIVVDFIDMEEKRNNRSVERRLKDALRHDRARIQVGRISHFGLLEMSRQRLRAGVLEGSTSQCPHCQGTGIIRSIESVALAVLRGLEDHLLKQPSSLAATTTAEVALYILNHKRAYITEMERRHGVTIRVEASDRMQGANFGVERIAAPVALAKPASRTAVSMEWGFDRDDDAVEEVEHAPAEVAADEDLPESREAAGARADAAAGEEERRGRRRRRRRGRRDREGEQQGAQGAAGDVAVDEAEEDQFAPDEPRDASRSPDHDEDAEMHSECNGAPADGIETGTAAQEAPRAEGDEAGEAPRRGRRRGRRGGRSRRREGGEVALQLSEGQTDDTDRHEWGIAELSRPGAEQPSSVASQGDEPAFDLVGSVDQPPGEQSSENSWRPSILESVDGPEIAPFAMSSDMALGRAVSLAGEPTESARSPAMISSEVLSAVDTASTPSPVETAPEASTAPPAPAHEPEPHPEPIWRTQTEAQAPVMPGTSPLEQARESEEPAQASPVYSSPAGYANGGGGEHHEHARDEAPSSPQSDDVPPPAPAAAEPPRPSRRGWWQRRFGSAE